MKDITIHVKIDDNNQVLTAVHAKGLDLKDNVEDKFTLIGILENIKRIELDKLSTLKSIVVNKKKDTGNVNDVNPEDL